jgi:hypothetical protein
VSVGLEVRNYLLPVGGEDVFVRAVKTLVHLFVVLALIMTWGWGEPYIRPSA